MKRPGARPVLMVLAWALGLSPAGAYYHFLHYTSKTAPYNSVPEKFDLAALPNKTVTVFVSTTVPKQFAQNDGFPSLLSQIRQATRAWDGVSTSDLRVAFGGLHDDGNLAKTPSAEVVFDDEIPPGLLAYTVPTSANDLVTLFLTLELISISTYILLYLFRIDPAAQEAALKYFLLSVFSSALLLFGFSYLYGLGGTTNIPALADALTHGDEDGALAVRLPAVVLIALVMIVSGLGFKITAVPFHFYAPDVYQGTATPAAALLAFVPKVAGFIALLRVLGFIGIDPRTSGLTLGNETPVFLWILAAFTMSLGNVLALLQTNLKRLLAYSSVAHAGYMLVALAAAHHIQASDKMAGLSGLGGVPAVLFYLVAYGGMTVGAFAVLAYLSTPERPVENEDDLAGLSRSHPGLALMMTLFLFSLIGIPLTAGFVGKLLIFLGALSVEGDRAIFYRELALLMALNAAIGAWYYLRIITKMYLHAPIKPLEPAGVGRSWPILAALWICTILTLGLGLPNPLTNRIMQIAEAPSIPQESNSPLASNR